MKGGALRLGFELFLLVNVALSSALMAKALLLPEAPLFGSIQLVQTRSFDSITLDEALHLHRGGLGAFVDARNHEDFQLGHIPGALSIPADKEPSAQDMNVLQRAPRVVVYCSTKSCQSSSRLAERLARLGVEGIAILDEGWEGWVAFQERQ